MKWCFKTDVNAQSWIPLADNKADSIISLVVMSTFDLRETLHWAREQSATVYVCCLDGKQAFDNVWHDGPIYKLIKLGLENSTLLALRVMYKDTSCHVKLCA